MPYKIRYLKPHFEDIIKKLKKKNKPIYNRLMKKIALVAQSPTTVGHILHGNMKGFWDTHVDMYVLIYNIDEKRKTVTLVYFDYHDRVFKTAIVAIPYAIEDLLRI
jgi:YafQ family addiction module toxin component